MALEDEDDDETIAWAATPGWMLNVGHFWPASALAQFRIGPYVSLGARHKAVYANEASKHSIV